LQLYSDEYKIPSGATVLVKMGQMIGPGAVIALANIHGTRTEIVACVSGRVTIGEDSISVAYEECEEREYEVPAPARLKIENGDRIHAGQQLTEGSLNPQDIHRIMGMESAQLYLVEEVKKVYRSQGVTINDKHIEVIARQMALRQVTVRDPGDTDLPANGIVDRFEYAASNAGVLAQGGNPAIAVPVLLGITKASLHAGSFLSAASFQETRRVLTEAAIGGQSDRLLGLKENVIVGRLIPARARVDIPPAPRRATIASVDFDASFPSQYLPDEVDELDDIGDLEDDEDFEDFPLYDPPDSTDEELRNPQPLLAEGYL
jgi:DNA-directed RNA polymerase subunit beta'